MFIIIYYDIFTASSKEKVKRVRWSIAEKTAVIQHYGDFDKLKNYQP